VSDAGTAALLAEAAARGALYTVRINANGLRDRSAAAELVREAEAHVALAEERAAAARTVVEAVLQR
jgi:glutamate formiminotransferase/formiminotetrahydrofolate cyclodeaminase